MELDKKQIIALADLAKLELSEEEIGLYQEQLKDVLSYVDKIKDLDLSKVKESLTGIATGALPRADKAKASVPGIIKQAGEIKNDYVVAPNVFNK